MSGQWSPAQIEDRLHQCITDLTRSELELRAARDAETEAEIAYRAQHRRAVLAVECPRVMRGGVTSAERDAWVDERCAEAWQAWRIAVTAREAAQDHSRAVRDVTSAVQTVAALTRAAFSLAGRDA